MIVASVFGCTNDETLAAAYLHDTIEDCDVDFDDIHERFGMTVAETVAALTKDMRLIEPERERVYDETLRKSSWRARLIKLADVYDNTADADTDARLKSCLDRAKRALAIAGDEPELNRAKEIVQAMIDRRMIATQ